MTPRCCMRREHSVVVIPQVALVLVDELTLQLTDA